jgi:hypothetical protein
MFSKIWILNYEFAHYVTKVIIVEVLKLDLSFNFFFFRNLRSAHIVELIGAVPNGFPYYILLGKKTKSIKTEE